MDILQVNVEWNSILHLPLSGDEYQRFPDYHHRSNRSHYCVLELALRIGSLNAVSSRTAVVVFFVNILVSGMVLLLLLLRL